MTISTFNTQANTQANKYEDRIIVWVNKDTKKITDIWTEKWLKSDDCFLKINNGTDECYAINFLNFANFSHYSEVATLAKKLYWIN